MNGDFNGTSRFHLGDSPNLSRSRQEMAEPILPLLLLSSRESASHSRTRLTSTSPASTLHF